MDPLTGHEAHGDLKDSFRSALQKMSYDKYKDLIDDFNKIMDDLSSQRTKALEKLGNPKFTQEIEKDFEPIIV